MSIFYKWALLGTMLGIVIGYLIYPLIVIAKDENQCLARGIDLPTLATVSTIERKVSTMAKDSFGSKQSVISEINELFDDPDMVAIAECESNFRQFNNDGTPLRGKITPDWGIFQINEPTWDKKAQELGLNYKNSAEDNLQMAKYILEVQGKEAWVCYKKVQNPSLVAVQ